MPASRLLLVLAVVLGLTSAACGNDDPPESGTGGGPSRSTVETVPAPRPSPSRALHLVRNEDCPQGFVGLLLATTVPAEVEYIDKIVACTDQRGGRTYLRNGSDAVWRLRNTGQVDGFVQPLNLAGAPFRYTFAAQGPLFVPGQAVVVELPPQQVQWDIDLPLSVSWEGYTQVREKFVSLGEAALLQHVKQRTPQGAAVVQCSLTVKATADAAGDLEDADFSEVVLNGLGVGVAANKCRQAASLVAVPEAGTSRPVALSDELQRLTRQTETLQKIESRLTTVARLERVVKFGLKLLLPG